MDFWMRVAALGLVVVIVGGGRAAGQTPPAASNARLPGSPAEVGAAIGSVAVATKSESTNALENAVNEAMSLLTRGQIKEAIPLFKSILRVDKSHRKALFGLGTCYVELRQYREATVVLERMIELYPDAFEALNNLAWMYATASDPQYRDGRKATEYAQRAILLAPKSFEIWNTLSESYFVAGEYEKAERAAAEAVRLSRENNAPARVTQEYNRQLEKCKRAAEAMSLVE